MHQGCEGAVLAAVFRMEGKEGWAGADVNLEGMSIHQTAQSYGPRKQTKYATVNIIHTSNSNTATPLPCSLSNDVNRSSRSDSRFKAGKDPSLPSFEIPEPSAFVLKEH